MKLVRSNGLRLEVRDVGDVLYHLTASPPGMPLPIIDAILDDDVARHLLKQLRTTEYYQGGRS